MGCIEWEGCFSNGYGWHEPTRQRAHRKTWIEHHGEIPKGKVIKHKCDNKKCYNIDHLEIGTQSENVKEAYDRRLKKATRKLTVDEAKDIFIRVTSGESGSGLSREYGISRQLVCDIKKGRTVYNKEITV